jgi:hypothetical protein
MKKKFGFELSTLNEAKELTIGVAKEDYLEERREFRRDYYEKKRISENSSFLGFFLDDYKRCFDFEMLLLGINQKWFDAGVVIDYLKEVKLEDIRNVEQRILWREGVEGFKAKIESMHLKELYAPLQKKDKKKAL